MDSETDEGPLFVFLLAFTKSDPLAPVVLVNELDTGSF